MTAATRSLEARLRSAAADAAWPPTPDLRTGVVARLEAPSPSVTRPAPGPDAPRVRRGPLIRALVLALLALLAIVGIAAALGFRLPGIDIVRVERLPTIGPAAGIGIVPGSPVPLAEVRNGESPRVLVPATLPEPATAFVEGNGDRRLVTLAWSAARGQPAIGGTDLSLVLAAVRGDIDEPLLEKALGPGTTIEAVAVEGDRGWWIDGAPHELFIRGPTGPDMLTSRLAGDTLVFTRDGTVYRLESSLGRDATVAIAASMR